MIEICTFALGTWKTILLDGPIKPAKRRVVNQAVRAGMYKEQRGKCAYCSQHLTHGFECDHMIPVKYGGPTCESNLHLLCSLCHKKKTCTERKLGAKRSHLSVYPSDSVVVKTRPGFPRIRPVDFRQLKPGVYTLDYGPHAPARHGVAKRVDKRITRSSGALVALKSGNTRNRRQKTCK